MTSEKLPDDFDWVSARSKCNSALVFERLKLQVKQDIEKREEICKQQQSPFRFSFGEEGRALIVLLQGHALYKTVRFEHNAEAIIVSNDETEALLVGTITLSNDGRCRVAVNGQEHELWQFRKMALEKLFFEPYLKRSHLKGRPPFSTNT